MPDPTLPTTAYVPLWLPLPSETFVFREVTGLRELGMNVVPYSIYGPKLAGLSPDMLKLGHETRNLGLKATPDLLAAQAYWFRRAPATARELWRTVPFRRWRNLETAGEAALCFLAGFHLARLFERHGIERIHAPWANGPATAAWVASRLSGIPFSFTGRARDILPPDGALEEKMRDAAGVHVDSDLNRRHLSELYPEHAHKVRLVYNSMTLEGDPDFVPDLTPPHTLLALGRLTAKKGFPVLLEACGLLKDEGFPFRLTIAGSGWEEKRLRKQVATLGLEDMVDMPGHVTHDQVMQLMKAHQAFIMPSVTLPSGDRDGLPTVILEAMATGLPVIATDVGGISEAVLHKETGLLCEEKNPEALRNAIRRLFDDTAATRNMIDKARKKANDLYNPDRNIRKLAAFMAGTLEEE